MRLEWVALATLFFCAALGHARVYRWVAALGGVHYSNTAPPAGAQASIVDIPAQPGPPSPESAECHTLRCQAERVDTRLEERALLEARLAAERAALAREPAHGLEFRRYIAIERGMTEGELLAVAGDPDLRSGGAQRSRARCSRCRSAITCWCRRAGCSRSRPGLIFRR